MSYFAIITRLLYSIFKIPMYHLRNLFDCQTKIHGLESRRPIGLQQGMVVYLSPGPAVVKIVSSNCHRPFRHLLTFNKDRFLSQRWHTTSGCAGHLATCFLISKYATYEYRCSGSHISINKSRLHCSWIGLFSLDATNIVRDVLVFWLLITKELRLYYPAERQR